MNLRSSLQTAPTSFLKQTWLSTKNYGGGSYRLLRLAPLRSTKYRLICTAWTTMGATDEP
ncbi:MAG TPA: hypothetical protein VGL22_08585 [Terracidiphilus sp.]